MYNYRRKGDSSHKTHPDLGKKSIWTSIKKRAWLLPCTKNINIFHLRPVKSQHLEMSTTEGIQIITDSLEINIVEQPELWTSFTLPYSHTTFESASAKQWAEQLSWCSAALCLHLTSGSRRSHWRGPVAASVKNMKNISKLGGSGGMPPGIFFFLIAQNAANWAIFPFLSGLWGGHGLPPLEPPMCQPSKRNSKYCPNWIFTCAKIIIIHF